MQEVRANSDCLVSVFCETYYVGRHRKRFEDNIREWTGLECAKSQRAVENREKWRKLVVKSPVKPKLPFQFRDR